MVAFSTGVMMSDHAWCPERATYPRASRDVLRDTQRYAE